MKFYLTKDDSLALQKKIIDKESKLSQLGLGLGDAMSRSGSFPASNPEYAAIYLDIQNTQQSIDQLKGVLDQYEVVDEDDISVDNVNTYSIIELEDTNSKKYCYYVLPTGISKKIGDNCLIATPESPIGTALLGHKIGESVEIKLPMGLLNLKIVTISK